MPLSFSLPHGDLQPYVSAYVQYEEQQPMPQQVVTPLGSQFVFLILNGSVTLVRKQGNRYALPTATLLGQHTHGYFSEQTFPSKVTAIKFAPFGARVFFDTDMITLKNSFLDVRDYVPERVLGALREAAGVEEVKLLLDTWLLGLPRRIDLADRVRQVIHYIDERRGNVSMDEVRDQFSYADRTLQRLFNKAIGISAKLYARVVRFNYAVSLLDHPTYSLQAIVHEAGYFDQSHFVKDCLEFTHCSPSAFKTDTSVVLSLETIRGLLKQH